MRRTVFLIAAAAVLFAQSAYSGTRPLSYAEFDSSVAASDGKSLKATIEGKEKKFIYIRPGTYVLKNPVVIDRDDSLFLHGADRMSTILVAQDPSQPLFVVKRATLVNLAGLHLAPAAQSELTRDARAIVTQNTQPLVFEMLDCGIDHSMLVFQGPGTYQLQAPVMALGGRVSAAILVDHPGADVFLFGGDATNANERLVTDDFAFVWQKRGRVRVYATTVEANLGAADIRIETASPLGAHIIANVRSEGVNGALNRSGAPSRLLYVPPSSDRVDVVLKGNGGAWDTGPLSDVRSRMNCSLISYSGAGTVWLLGNRAEGFCGRHIAEGNAPNATIVSIGNLISSPEPFTITAKRIISADDLYNHLQWTGGGQESPSVRWIPDGDPPPKLSSYKDIPLVPEDLLPPSLARPAVQSALPGTIDVRVPPYNAKGDATTDDTEAIQKALNANCDKQTPKLIYFPKGQYRITNTLYLNHHLGKTCHGAFPYGGWIAGAGSAVTTIQMDPRVKKAVFATDGLAWSTVQGLTFKTFKYQPGDPEAVNFDIEFYPGYIASQLDNFYDVVFDGGFAAFATGVAHPTGAQCSSIVAFGAEMRNAHIGFVSGHFNALSNGVYDSRLLDNDYAMGSWTNLSNQGPGPTYPMPAGGTFFGYRSVSKGTRIQDFIFAGSATGSTWYFYDWTSDAPLFFVSKPTAVPWPIMFDHSHLDPRPGSIYVFDVASSMGPFFLYSIVSRSAIRLGQTSMGQSYAIKLQSKIPDWSNTIAPKPYAQTDEIGW
jgi:hypothetical protein